jgi:hypothetical protein
MKHVNPFNRKRENVTRFQVFSRHRRESSRQTTRFSTPENGASVDPMKSCLLRVRHVFGEVSGFIDFAASGDGGVAGQELKGGSDDFVIS